MTNPIVPPALAAARVGAREAVARIKRGEMKAECYLANLLHHYAAHKDLNAIITIDEGRVLEEARRLDKARDNGEELGRLAGLPFVVKDQMEIAGYPTSVGNGAMKRYRSKRSASVAQTMIDAGAIMYGKANCGDMTDNGAYMISHITNSSPFFGFARNPYDTSRIPGGSSGGNAVAIASGIVPAGLGEDTGGSIRVPAGFSGIVGFRPSTFTIIKDRKSVV